MPLFQTGEFMKMLLVLLSFVMATGAVASNNYIDNTSVVQSRVAEFITVKNGAASALTKGMAVCFDLTDDNGVNVDFCYAEGAKPVGVVAEASCAVGKPCKLQTKGFIDFGKFDYLATATVAGGMIYAGTDGDLVVPSTVTVAMFPLGSVFDAVAADSTSLEVYIDL